MHRIARLKTTLLFLVIITANPFMSWGQSIGKALEKKNHKVATSKHGNKKNATSKQSNKKNVVTSKQDRNNHNNITLSPGMTASDLSYLCLYIQSKDLSSYLINLGWEDSDSTYSDDVKTTIWAFGQSKYNEDNDRAWLDVSSDIDGVEQVTYRFASEKFKQNLERTVSSAGFQPFDFREYGDEISAGYQSDRCLLLLDRNGEIYRIRCIRKNSRFDRLNDMTTIEEESILQGNAVEIEPEFPGGIESLYKFLSESLKYPSLAMENNIEGTVYVTFVVEKDGSITDIRILRDIGGGCGQEVVRVIKTMPRWIPGKQYGKNVRVQFNIPVNFKVN